MGDPIFSWQKIPLSKNIDCKNINLKIGNEEFKNGYALNVGNPHIVFFGKSIKDTDLENIGPKIENLSLIHI